MQHYAFIAGLIESILETRYYGMACQVYIPGIIFGTSYNNLNECLKAIEKHPTNTIVLVPCIPRHPDDRRYVQVGAIILDLSLANNPLLYYTEDVIEVKYMVENFIQKWNAQ